jgi:hypothetical protein
MKLTRAHRLALYASVGATATLASPALATAETLPPAGLPVQPCLSSSSLPVANPLPCSNGGTVAPSGGQPGGAGANGSAGASAAGVNGAAGASGPTGLSRHSRVKGLVKVKVRRTTHKRRSASHHSRHVVRHAKRRHH